MTRFLLVFAASALMVANGVAAEQSLLARVTVYWRGESQACASWNGARLRNGHCAVDPKRIPYGSTVTIDGEELIAVDTGPSVVNRKAARLTGRTAAERNAIVVDRYFETKAQAAAWEKCHGHFLTVRVVPPAKKAPHLAELNKAPISSDALLVCQR